MGWGGLVVADIVRRTGIGSRDGSFQYRRDVIDVDAAEHLARLYDTPGAARANRIQGTSGGPVYPGESKTMGGDKFPPPGFRRNPALAALAGRLQGACFVDPIAGTIAIDTRRRKVARPVVGPGRGDRIGVQVEDRIALRVGRHGRQQMRRPFKGPFKIFERLFPAKQMRIDTAIAEPRAFLLRPTGRGDPIAPLPHPRREGLGAVAVSENEEAPVRRTLFHVGDLARVSGLVKHPRVHEFRVMTWRTVSLPVLTVALAVGTGPEPAAAQSLDELAQREYRACITHISIDPNQAFEKALAWQDLGGGAPAQHCAAAALIALGHHREAATRLEALATNMPDDTPEGVVAGVLAHAGIAWLDAGDAERAYAVQTSALLLSPRNPDILGDRAMTLAQQNRYWEAVDDLTRALETEPGRVDLMVLRASAYRFIDADDLALEDLERALQIDPENPEALLERGIQRRLAGDKDGARKDWLDLIRLHDGRPAAEMARRNIEKLDLAEE